MATKKTKQLSAKAAAFGAATDNLIKVWVATRDIKEWIKESRSALKDYEKAQSDYSDELSEYGSEGNRSESRAGAAARLQDPDADPVPAEWIDRVDEKLEILGNNMSDSWAETLIDDVEAVIKETKSEADSFVKQYQTLRKIPDPTDIDDDDPDYF